MLRLLRRLLDKAHELVGSGKRLERMAPLINATDAFFFGPAEVTRSAPHIRDRMDVKRYMTIVIIGLMPAVVLSVHFWGWCVLRTIMVSYIFGGAVEVIFACVRREPVNEGFLVTGMLFPLTLPATTPWWVVALGIVFGVVFGKEIFGGTGKNFFNPALVGRLFVVLTFPLLVAQPDIWPHNAAEQGYSGFKTYETSRIPVDAYTSATPLTARKRVVNGEVDRSVLPPTKDLFLGRIRGCIGEPCALALILGGIFIILVRVASWRIVVSCILSGALFTFIMNRFGPIGEGGIPVFADPLYTLFSGGYMLGAFFMATDPVSAPVNKGAKWFYGGLIGLSTVFIRSIGGFPEGMMFSILLANVFSPLMEQVAVGIRYRKRAVVA